MAINAIVSRIAISIAYSFKVIINQSLLVVMSITTNRSILLANSLLLKQKTDQAVGFMCILQILKRVSLIQEQ